MSERYDYALTLLGTVGESDAERVTRAVERSLSELRHGWDNPLAVPIFKRYDMLDDGTVTVDLEAYVTTKEREILEEVVRNA